MGVRSYGIWTAALIAACIAVLLAPARLPYRVLWVAAGALAVTAIEFRSVRSLGMSRHAFRATILWAGGLAAFAAIGVGEVLQPLVERLLGEPSDYSGYGPLAGNETAALRLWGYAMLSAAIGEEIVFRGFLLSRLDRLAGPFVAVLLSTFVFALAHAKQGLPGVIATGVVGLVFAIAWYRSGRNLPALILAHAFTDTYGVAMLYFGRYA